MIEGKRVNGPTPNGGAYSILYTHGDGSMEIVEFDDQGEQLCRTSASRRPPARCMKTPPTMAG